MAGRRWLIIGAVLGVAMAFGGVPWITGAARVLADTALSVVAGGGRDLVRSVATAGVQMRIVDGVTGVVAVLAPGVTALLLVVAARATLRVRGIVGLLIVALGAAAFAYHPSGIAIGTLALVLAVAALAVAATGPLVATPLSALAGLLAGTYLPGLLLHADVSRAAVSALHTGIYGTAGAPFWLRVVLVVVAVLPFVLALRGVLRR